MRYVALSTGLFCALGARTQNLVPNPSFETVTSCPTFASMLNLAAPWYNPTQGTPELYHGCAPNGDFAGVPLNYSGGFQYARTGVGFAGIYTFRVGVPQMREYIEVPLLQPLMAGSCYTFSMYVNMPNEFELVCDGIGAHFSIGPVSSNSPFVLALTPQIDHPLGVLITDTLGWTEVSGTYTAGGGETHLTIGNFRNDANTTWALFNPGVWYTEQAYLLVDDVSLVPVLDELDLGPDTALCGGSYILDATVPGATATLWNDGVTTAQRTVTSPGTYSVQVSGGDCAFTDTVLVGLVPLPYLELGADRTLCNGTNDVLHAVADAGTTVVWDDGTIGTDRTIHGPGLYYATVSNTCGSVSDSVLVVSEECPDGIYLPNAFTPNNDGMNDSFAPVYDPRVWSLEFVVFDRWGQALFNGTSGASWSADEVPSGIYVVQVKAQLLAEPIQHRELLGHVAVVR